MFGGLFGDFGTPATTSNTGTGATGGMFVQRGNSRRNSSFQSGFTLGTEGAAAAGIDGCCGFPFGDPYKGAYQSLQIQEPVIYQNTEDMEMEEMSSLELSASHIESPTAVTGFSDPQIGAYGFLQTQQPTNYLNTEEEEMEISSDYEESVDSPMTEIFRLSSPRTQEKKNQASFVLSRRDVEPQISATGSTGGAGTPGECPLSGGSTAGLPIRRGGFTIFSPGAAGGYSSGGGTGTPRGYLFIGEATAETPASRGRTFSTPGTANIGGTRGGRISFGDSHSATSRIQQLQNDEEFARALQEEMNREFAVSLRGSMGAGHFGSTLSPPRAEQVPYDQRQPSPRGNRRNLQRVFQLPASITADTESLLPDLNFESIRRRVDLLLQRLGELRHQGLSSKEISQLPITSCKKQTNGDAAEKCNICMEAYEEGQQKRYLPCFHCFHVPCIDQWLEEKASCPICRMDIHIDGSTP